MDKRKSFVFAKQYSNCFSRRINALVPRYQPIKTAIGMVTHDFHGWKTMTFHRIADIISEVTKSHPKGDDDMKFSID